MTAKLQTYNGQKCCLQSHILRKLLIILFIIIKCIKSYVFIYLTYIQTIRTIHTHSICRVIFLLLFFSSLHFPVRFLHILSRVFMRVKFLAHGRSPQIIDLRRRPRLLAAIKIIHKNIHPRRNYTNRNSSVLPVSDLARRVLHVNCRKVHLGFQIKSNF
jgi:hypothetical protein